MRTRSQLDAADARAPAAVRHTGAEIDARGLRHEYRTPGGILPVLQGVHLHVPAGGYASLSGPSGSGKTTLLSLLGGLERPQAGSLVVGGTDMATLGRDALAAFRRRTVGFVFQHFGLLDTLSARENVELACMLAGLSRSARRMRAVELLDAVALAPRADHRPAALSGGERQRVAIARSMANNPAVILADEPTGNLDEGSAAAVVELLESLRRDRGITLVMVTHHRELAARAVQRWALEDGRVLSL